MRRELGEMTRKHIEESSHFFVLASEDYVQSLRDPEDNEHHFLIEEISYAKSLNKPTILLLEKKLSQEDQNLVLSVLAPLPIVGKLEFDMDAPNSSKDLASRIGEMMKK